MLLIVAGHCFPFSSLSQSDSFIGMLLINAITNGSTIFVFISGFFFYHVFYSKFNYQNFLFKKFKSVVVPYLIISTAVVLLFRLGQPDSRMGGFFSAEGAGFLEIYVFPYLKYIFFGGATTAYWFIPFIFAMFCLSPLHRKFAELNSFSAICIMLGSLLLSVFVSRPQYNLNIFHSLVYYQFYYLIGVFFAKNYKSISSWLANNYIYVFIAFISTDVAIAYYFPIQNIEDGVSQSSGLDYYVLLKMLEIMLLISLFERFSVINCKLLSHLADMSFAIYFIHPIIIGMVRGRLGGVTLFNPWCGYGISLFLVMALCVLLSLIIKKALKVNSRLIIGW